MKDLRIKSLFSYATKAAYFALMLLTFIFIITKNILPAILIPFAAILIISLELMRYSLGYGFLPDSKDVLAAFFGSLLFMLALVFLLGFSSPLHFIASCSMLPSYLPADAFFVLQENYQIPIVEISYPFPTNSSATVFIQNHSLSVVGSFYSYCTLHKGEDCNTLVLEPQKVSEQIGPVTYHYGSCLRADLQGNTHAVPCVKRASVGGQEFTLSEQSPILAFSSETLPTYPQNSLISHRAWFAIRDSIGNTYYFTKGDNNPIFDSQYFDYENQFASIPVSDSQIKGKLAFRIPLIGRLSRNFKSASSLPGCDSYLLD